MIFSKTKNILRENLLHRNLATALVICISLSVSFAGCWGGITGRSSTAEVGNRINPENVNTTANISLGTSQLDPKRRAPEDDLSLGGLIIPGQSVGNVFLGDSGAELDKVANETFKKKSEGDYPVFTVEHTLQKGFPFDLAIQISDTMPNQRLRGSGWKFFSRNDSIKVIKVATVLAGTRDGITPRYSTVGDVLKLPGKLRKYELMGSNKTKLNGSRDLRYLVDQERGIAYEFAYRLGDAPWEINFIYIFSPEEEFFPVDNIIDSEQTKFVERPKGWRD